MDIRKPIYAVWALLAIVATIAGCGGCALLYPEGEASWAPVPATEVAQ